LWPNLITNREVYKEQLRRAVTKLSGLVAGFLPRLPGLEPVSDHVGFVVEKKALAQAFFQYFRFPLQFSFHRLFHIHNLSSWAGKIGEFVADKPSVLSLTPPQ
jgi:hypothetical protein